MKNELTNYMVVNDKTGEIDSWLTKKEKTRLDKMRTSASIIDDKDSKKNDSLFAEFVKEKCGEFYHVYYSNVIDKKYLFRFIYLCTYMNYKNYIVLGNAKDENQLATKKDLKEILKLEKKQFYETINYFINNGLIEITDKDYIKVNINMSQKGKLNKKLVKNGIARIFNNIIREIYNKSTAREHEKLGLLIRLLPNVNLKTNVICFNPEEDNNTLIEPIDLKTLSQALGYSRINIFKKGLFDITVNGEKAIMMADFNNIKMIVVNPKIYYKGSNLKDMQGIINLFEIANKF